MTEQLSTEEQEHLMGIFKSKNVIYSHFLPDIDNDAKHDLDVKMSTFMTGISSFLPDPINEIIKGDTGVGKTFVVKTVLSYFPDETTMYIGKQSATAFYHDNGVLMTKGGQVIDTEKEPMKPIRKVFKTDSDFDEAKVNYEKTRKAWNAQLKESYTLIDLSHKIMFFLETQNDVYINLFPILSHDKKEIDFNFTDKTAKGNLKTRHVKVRGYPSAIFLMTERYLKRGDELATRALCISPENTTEKYYDANKMATRKNSRKWEQDHERPIKTELKALIKSIQKAFVEDGYDTIIPFENLDELYPHEQTRDMRDYTHFQQFINAITALHIHQRVIAKIEDKKYVISSVQDVQLAFDAFSKIFESTRANADQSLLKFYWDYCILLIEGFTTRQLVDSYNDSNQKKKYGYNTINSKINALARKGYLDKRPSEFGDQKTVTYVPLKLRKEELTYNPTEHENRESLSVFLAEGLKSWLSNVPLNSEYYKLSNRKNGIIFELVEINRQEAEEKILCVNMP